MIKNEEVDYTPCSIMLKGRVNRKINLDEFYDRIYRKYRAEYTPEITNRLMVYLDDASILFFASGTIQIYLKNPDKKVETIKEVNKMLSLMLPLPSACP